MNITAMFDAYVDFLTIYKHPDSSRYVLSHKKPLIDYFGDIDSSEITVLMVQKFVLMQKQKKLSPNTINKRVALLKRICKFNKVGYLDFFDIPNIRVPFKTYGYLDELSKKKLFLAMEKMTDHQLIMFRLLYETGLRRTELVMLLVKEIDFKKRSIHVVTTKTDKDRYVFFTSETGILLKNYIDARNPKEYLFSHADGRPLDPHAVTSLFQRVKEWSGIKKLSPHMLRHTFTTDLYDKGANLIFIQGMLGHSDPKTTKRYVHRDIDHDRILYDKSFKPVYGRKSRVPKNKK